MPGILTRWPQDSLAMLALPPEPAVDLRMTARLCIGKHGLVSFPYPDTSPSRTASRLAFKRERHFLFTMNRKHRVFEVVVGSTYSDTNWLLQQVHLVDKPDTPPLPYSPW